MENSIMKEQTKWPLLDNLHSPLTVAWDVTNRCNFRCKHCYNCSGEDNELHAFKDELTEAESWNVVQQIIEVRPYSMCLCGGEPLLKKNLVEMVRQISSHGIQVNMVSNGYLMTKERAYELKRAGLNFCQISLDGLQKETHDEFRQRKGAFDRAVEAIKYLVEAGITTATSFCPNKTNINEFEEYVDFVKSLGCKMIRMMPFVPMGRGYKNNDELSLTSEDYVDFIYKIYKKQRETPAIKFKLDWGDPLEHIYLAAAGRKVPIAMEIKANGNIGCSAYLPIVCGNVRNHSLKEYWEMGFKNIWQYPEVQNIIRNITNLSDFQNVGQRTWIDQNIVVDLEG